MFDFVRFVVKPFMRSSETTPPNIAGTPSSLAAIREANCLALGHVPINAPIAAPLEFLSQKCTALSGRDVDRCIRPLSRQVGAELEHVCE